ncbi:hypothetical protein D3C86_646960 [compost metagenome]
MNYSNIQSVTWRNAKTPQEARGYHAGFAVDPGRLFGLSLHAFLDLSSGPVRLGF